jgi:hypothetical protein
MNKLIWLGLLIGGTAAADTKPAKMAPVKAAPAKVAAGPVTLGCFAWSASARAAACITGINTHGEGGELQLQYVGSKEPPVTIVGTDTVKLDAATAAKINATLAKHGFTPVGARMKAESGIAMVAGKTTVTATIVPKQKAYNFAIKAACGKGTSIYAEEGSDGQTAEFFIRPVGDDLIVELETREKLVHGLGAWVFDSAACTTRQ